MLAFVTVGSTRFDSLIQATFSEHVLASLHRKGYTELVIQCGNSSFELTDRIKNGEAQRITRGGLEIEFWKFKPTLQSDFEKADLVISHAGSGTILDVLRMGKSMIVIPNPTLLDNHQEELASELEELGHLKATTVVDLPKAIEEFEQSNIKPFPPFEPSRFARIMDEVMGFIHRAYVLCNLSPQSLISMAPKAVASVKVEGSPVAYENENVHTIYDQIATHFSMSRYKPWPIIANFLSSLSTGWVGLDSGTGNGKYLPLPPDRPGDIWTIGLDRSRNLLEIAKTAGSIRREVVWGNVLGNPWRLGVFDYAISIATIHHLATRERRRLAVEVCGTSKVSWLQGLKTSTQRLLQAVSPSHGRILIYVWAIDQDELSKRRVVTETDESLSEGKDVMVPWVLSKELSKASQETSDQQPQVFNRYYHMFGKGELAGLVGEAAAELGLRVGPKSEQEGNMGGVEIIQDGWERSNYYVELRCWDSLSVEV